MAALTINKDEDPIAALLNSQAIEKLKAQQQQFQQSLPHYGAPAVGDYQQPYGYAQSLNAMREALMPYIRNMPFLYQPTDLPINTMLLGAHPMASDSFRGPPEAPPRMEGYYGGTASYDYPMKLYGRR